MTEQVSLSEARAQLNDLVHRAASSRARVTITYHGEPAAVLVNPQELADLDEALALADHRAQQTAGTLRTVPHDQVRTRLGLPGQ
jgi:prevent-host-death family protein